MFDTYIQTIILLVISILMFVTVLVLRPYTDHARNFFHVFNEASLIFLASAILYFKAMDDSK